jgi:hypothetical protein
MGFGTLQGLAKPLLYRRFELTLASAHGAESGVYDLIHRRVLDRLSRWTWHMVLNNAAERVNAATCILTSATSLRSLRIPGSAREAVASAGVLATAASAAGHSLERLVACVHKNDYLAIA